MNREIMFRAWDGKKMIYNITQWYVSEQDNKYHLVDGWPLESLMQFTGLKDKNGKEAYENDIVDTWPFYLYQGNCKGKNRYQKITFDGGMFATENFDFGWEGEGTVRIENCEIIGNIYENPELLTPTP